MVSWKANFPPMSTILLLKKQSHMQDRSWKSVWILSSSDNLRFKRCRWNETEKLLWRFFHRQNLGEKREKIQYFFSFLTSKWNFGIPWTKPSHFSRRQNLHEHWPDAFKAVSCSLSWSMLSMLLFTVIYVAAL